MPAEKKVCSLQRKRISPYYLSSLFILLVLLTAFGCQQHVEQKTSLAPPPSGVELFKSKCSKCHDPERALQQYRSAEVWEDTITRMKQEREAERRQHIEQQEREQERIRQKKMKLTL